jgi:hypothetical protein
MTIDNNKFIYFYDQAGCQWYWYEYRIRKFTKLIGTPKLTENFAGIGSANLNENGVNAIKEIYRINFNKNE